MLVLSIDALVRICKKTAFQFFTSIDARCFGSIDAQCIAEEISTDGLGFLRTVIKSWPNADMVGTPRTKNYTPVIEHTNTYQNQPPSTPVSQALNGT